MKATYLMFILVSFSSVGHAMQCAVAGKESPFQEEKIAEARRRLAQLKMQVNALQVSCEEIKNRGAEMQKVIYTANRDLPDLKALQTSLQELQKTPDPEKEAAANELFYSLEGSHLILVELHQLFQLALISGVHRQQLLGQVEEGFREFIDERRQEAKDRDIEMQKASTLLAQQSNEHDRALSKCYQQPRFRESWASR